MTTVAWKPGILVADKQASEGDLAHTCTKMFECEGSAIGFAGSLDEGLQFVKWFKKRKGKHPLKKTDALVMNLATGECEHWEAKCSVPVPIEDECTAIGSGGSLAIGAMEAGASPKRAIEIAARRDTGTGMGIQVIKSKRG